MTRLELEQFVKELIGKEQVVDGAFYTPDELLRALNRAQQDVALDLRIPRRFFVVTTTTPFDLPEEARGGGLISVAVKDDGTTLPIYSVQEANQKHPGWTELPESFSSPQFIVYDPGNISSTVTVVPKQTVERTYLIHYLIRPADLDTADSIPFNADKNLVDLHPLIAYKAAAYLFETDKTPDGVHQANRMLQRYELEKMRLRPKVLRMLTARIRNRFWTGFFRK